jgi:hypothetical protein
MEGIRAARFDAAAPCPTIAADAAERKQRGTGDASVSDNFVAETTARIFADLA